MMWEMWVYYAIGLIVAYWYQRREGNPEREHEPDIQLVVLGVLGLIWPVLLLAVLINRQPAKPKSDSPKPDHSLEVHREWCHRLEALVQQKIDRPLTDNERDKIWNCGSSSWLEVLDLSMMGCQTPAQAERWLEDFPTLGPLPPEYTTRG
jgi:hypothetical protein